MRGRVIDLGGKRIGKRGAFRPPTEGILCWHYINVETSCRPHLSADIGLLPVKGEAYDVAICTETLEHTMSPGQCVAEMRRILKPGGLAIVTIPFLFPIHADPQDYYRFTADGLKLLFSQFSEVSIGEMGGYSETVRLMLQLGWRRLRRRKPMELAAFCFLSLATAFVKVACHLCGAHDWQGWTTGYYVLARR